MSGTSLLRGDALPGGTLGPWLGPYWAVLGARYRMLLQYRAAALAGVVTQFFWGTIRIMVLYAFYASSQVEPDLGFERAVAYIWLGQALLGLQPWNHDPEVERDIRDGRVAYEWLRPIDLYTFWYARVVAWRLAATSLRAPPIVFGAGILIPALGVSGWALTPPASLGTAGLFVLALVLGVALSAALTTLVHVSLLFTISGDGMVRLMPAMVMLFSGMILPLPLFPDWVQPLLRALPFRGLVDVPFRIYSGHLPVTDAVWAIAGVALWTLVLVALGRSLLARAHVRVIVQGG